MDTTTWFHATTWAYKDYVTQVEVVKETEKRILIRSKTPWRKDYYRDKSCSGEAYFKTREEASDWVIKQKENDVKGTREALARAEKELEDVRRLLAQKAARERS